jgi:hypothetical protein
LSKHLHGAGIGRQKKQTTNLVPKSTKLEKMMVRNSQATFSSGDANDIADEMKNADKI